MGGFLGAFVVAVLLHTAWDSFEGIVPFAVLAVISLTLLAVTTHRLGHDRRSHLRDATVPSG